MRKATKASLGRKKATGSTPQRTSASLAKLSRAIEAANIGFWEWFVAENRIAWSASVHKIFGLAKRALTGDPNSYFSRIHPEDKARVQTAIDLVRQEGRNYAVQHRIFDGKGEIRWIEAVGNLVDSGGKTQRVAGVVRDITNEKKIEAEREDWKIRFDLISKSAGIVIYDYNVLTGCIQWSGRVEEVLGYSKNEMGDIDRWGELIHEDDRTAAFASLDAAQQQLTGYDVTYRFKQKSGQYIAMQDRGFFAANKQGKAVRMLGIMHDITERLEAENRFRDLIRNLSVGVLLQNEKSEMLVSNKAALDLLGLTESQLLGKSSFDPSWNVIHEDGSSFPGHMHPVPEAIRTGSAVRNVIMGVHRPATNDRIWLLVTAEPIFRADGNLLHVICTFSDISELKKYQLELQESELRFRSLQQASFGGIAIHDKGKILDCNQGLSDITGYTQEELIGKNGLELIAEDYRDMVLNRISTNYEKAYDLEGIRKDGTQYSLEARGKNIPYQGKQLRVTEFRDISDRKKTEQEIVEQNARLTAIADNLRRKNEQLEEFTQIVSHNLRSPVGNILSLLEFYEMSASDTERNEYISLLKESGKKTLATLHDLHEVLSIKQNKNIERENVSLQQVYKSVELMLQAKIIQTKARIKTDFSRAPTVHYPLVYMESIVLNLMSNALKYSDPAKLCEIELESTVENEKIILQCRDNGLGIDLNRYKHQIFKMRKVFHPNPESRGIGLFLIKNQIETMGGEISVTSEPSVGSVFTVIFNKFTVTHD